MTWIRWIPRGTSARWFPCCFRRFRWCPTAWVLSPLHSAPNHQIQTPLNTPINQGQKTVQTRRNTRKRIPSGSIWTLNSVVAAFLLRRLFPPVILPLLLRRWISVLIPWWRHSRKNTTQQRLTFFYTGRVFRTFGGKGGYKIRVRAACCCYRCRI